jgi:cytidine deaminase
MEAILKKLEKLIKNAYAPYSKFRVAAIVITDNGDFTGVNVENASYGLSICAERSAITNAVANGVRKIKTLYLLTTSEDNNIVPCGACLQVMSEFSIPTTKIIVYNKLHHHKIYKFTQLLPHTFKFNNKHE